METVVQERYVVKAILSKTGKTSRPSVVDTETGEEVCLLKRGREYLAERAAKDLNENIGKPHFEPGDRVVNYGLNGPRFGIVRRPEVGEWLRPSFRGYRGAEFISPSEFLFGEGQWSKDWVVDIERAGGEVDRLYTKILIPVADFKRCWHVVKDGKIVAGGGLHITRERADALAVEYGGTVVVGAEVTISE